MVEPAEDIELFESSEPPAGSGITYEENRYGDSVFVIPKRGLRANDIFLLGLATIWLFVIGFWTYSVFGVCVPFALLSIPFWIYGIGMWRGVLIDCSEGQRILLSPEQLTVAKKSAVSSSVIEIPCAEIEQIELQPPIPRTPLDMTRHMAFHRSISRWWDKKLLVTIAHGTRKTTVAERVSDAEMKWLVRMLKFRVLTRNRRQV